MTKVCFLTSTISYGGATKIMVDVANYLSGFHDVCLMYYGTDDSSFYYINNNVKVFQAPKTKCNIRRIRLLTQMRIIRRYIKRINPDVVVAFGNTEKLMALGGTIGTKTKVIISERQDPYNYRPGRKTTMWLRYLLADGCVFQTEGASKYFPLSVQNKSVIIPNFIIQEKKRFISIEDKEKIISFSARFELKQKRQDIMVEAFDIVSKEYPDWKLVFYGDGEDQAYVERMVKERNLNNRIIFAGKVANVLDSIYRSAIFVICSDYEGIPNALMEAMGLGLPCVSTDCSPGGAKLLISDEENGLLVPTNSPNELANAIIRLINDTELANYLSQNATDVLSRFNPSNILPKWNEYICKVISK